MELWSRMARTTQLGNTAPRFKPPKETAGRTGPVQQTTTIRIHIEQAYTQQCEAILTNPGRHFRAWAQDNLGQYIQDTWGWQLGPGCQGKNTRIQGLAKINSNKVKLALQLSGQTTDGIRCFTEPAKRDLDYPGSEPTVADWITPDPNEAWQQYAARARQQSTNYGVVRGPKLLGTRRALTAEEKQQPQKSTKTMGLRDNGRNNPTSWIWACNDPWT